MDAVTEPHQIPPETHLNVAEAFMLAGDLFKASDFEGAGNIFTAITMADPSNFHAFNALAVCLIEQKKHNAAMSVLDRAGTLIRDEMVTVTSNRGRCLVDMGRAEEGLATFDNIIKNCPTHTLSYYNRGLAKLQLGKYEDSIADMNTVLAAEPDNAKARFGRGFANLVLGQYLDGFADYECRLKDKIELPDAIEWDGSQDLKGKYILVHGEMGYGDNIMFARYLTKLTHERGARVFVYVTENMRPLFRPLVLSGLSLGLLSDDRTAWPRLDYWVRFMSLAGCFKTELATVPPPMAVWPSKGAYSRLKQVMRLPDHSPALSAQPTPKRVGLVWSGGRKSRYDEYRSIPLAALAPLFKVAGHEFYSLQLDVRDEDKAAFNAAPLINLEPEIKNFQDTADIIHQLDLVITVDTSVAHLAGSCGVPTWVMLTAFRTYWLWVAEMTVSPWYPSIRLFRQGKDGTWAKVVEQVVSALNET